MQGTTRFQIKHFGKSIGVGQASHVTILSHTKTITSGTEIPESTNTPSGAQLLASTSTSDQDLLGASNSGNVPLINIIVP